MTQIYAQFVIEDAIIAGDYVTAQAMCDSNTRYHRDQITKNQDLFNDAQRARNKAAGIAYTAPDSKGARPLAELLEEERVL